MLLLRQPQLMNHQLNFVLIFFLEIHACNESENYLGILIHEIGIELKSLAYCSQIRCIRESYFTLDDALVKRHWNLETIMANLKRCREIIQNHPDILDQDSPTLKHLDEKKKNEARLKR